MQKLEFDDVDVKSLPPHLSGAVRTLLSEIELSGEETTADETIAVIEVLVSFLGRIWVSYYVHHGAPDVEINQFLFQSMQRDPGVGQWAGISRAIQAFFIAEQSDCIDQGLINLDYGFDGSVTQLITFRNSFSHGSMESVVSELHDMRQKLANLIKALSQVLSGSLLWIDENRVVRKVNESWDEALGQQVEVSNMVPYHIYIRTLHDGILTTYPLLVVRVSGDSYELDVSSTHVSELSYHQIFQLDCLAGWYQQYQKERAGYLNFKNQLGSSFRVNRHHVIWESVLSRLGAGNSPCRILINEPAGLSAKFIFKNLLVQKNDSAIGRRFDLCTLYIVRSDHVSQSGLTFCCFLLRQIEKLSQGTFKFENIPKDHIGELRRGLDYLRDSGKQLLIGICDLHYGDLSYRGENLTVLDVYNQLSESSITVVSSALRGSIKGLLSYDDCFSLESRKRLISLDHYTNSLAFIHRRYGDFPVRVLAVLCSIRRPRTLFEICDLLEMEWGCDVFEPKVEKALWRLAPFLIESRDISSQEKKWVPTFHVKKISWDQFIGDNTHV